MLRLFIGLIAAVCVPAGNYCWKFWLCNNNLGLEGTEFPAKAHCSG
jgi:hypothetical protein